MAEFYSYEGLMTSGTFKVAPATATAVAADPKQLCGKVVTMTGNYEVGYGTAGAKILGVVETVEKESTNSNTLVVAVKWTGTFEDIACAGSETAGTPLAVDGQGGVQASGTSSAPVYLGAIALGVDATAKTCTILL